MIVRLMCLLHGQVTGDIPGPRCPHRGWRGPRILGSRDPEKGSERLSGLVVFVEGTDRGTFRPNFPKVHCPLPREIELGDRRGREQPRFALK